MKKLLDRGYVFENKKKYEEYIQNLDTKISIKEKEIVPNFLLIPSYECNFKCSYCYEQKYNHSIYKKNRQWIKYAFEFIDNLANKYLNCNKMKTKKDIVITLMGGEPLMLKNKKEISLIISEIGKRQYTYNIISNGYEIDCYMNCFLNNPPSAVQITLDGLKETHNLRRKSKENFETFDKIIKNIHLLVKEEIPVQIRINVDQNNIKDTKQLVNFLKEEFNDSMYCKPYMYPIQDGGCLNQEIVLDEAECIKEINRIYQNNEQGCTCIFHGSDFVHAIKHNMPMKYKMKNCSANKLQYILDSSGNIYKCWFGVGNKAFSLGSYFSPQLINWEKDLLWQTRSIETLSQCKKCKYRYLCGGGCLSHVYKTDDDIQKPRCIDYYTILKEQFIRFQLYQMELM